MSIAAVNGPASVALSGTGGRLQPVLGTLRDAGFEVRPLAIPIAAHSAAGRPHPRRVRGRGRPGPVRHAAPGRHLGDDGPAGHRRRRRDGELLASPPPSAGPLRRRVPDDPRSWRAHVRGDRPAPDAAQHGPSHRAGAGERVAALVAFRSRRVAPAPRLGGPAVRRRRRRSTGPPSARPVGAVVTLPTYPFQRERYWADVAPAPPVAPRRRWAPAAGDPRPVAGDCPGPCSRPSSVRRGRRSWTTTGSTAPPCCHRRPTWRWRSPPARRSTPRTRSTASPTSRSARRWSCPTRADVSCSSSSTMGHRPPLTGRSVDRARLRRRQPGAGRRRVDGARHRSPRPGPTTRRADAFDPDAVRARCPEHIDGAAYYARLADAGPAVRDRASGA